MASANSKNAAMKACYKELDKHVKLDGTGKTVRNVVFRKTIGNFYSEYPDLAPGRWKMATVHGYVLLAVRQIGKKAAQLAGAGNKASAKNMSDAAEWVIPRMRKAGKCPKSVTLAVLDASGRAAAQGGLCNKFI